MERATHDDAARYLTLTAYQEALKVQLNLLNMSIERFRGSPRQMLQEEINRVTEEYDEVKNDIALVSVQFNFPLPPSNF